MQTFPCVSLLSAEKEVGKLQKFLTAFVNEFGNRVWTEQVMGVLTMTINVITEHVIAITPMSTDVLQEVSPKLWFSRLFTAPNLDNLVNNTHPLASRQQHVDSVCMSHLSTPYLERHIVILSFRSDMSGRLNQCPIAKHCGGI